MNYRDLLDNITPEIYASLKRAVELGKWPDGRRLTVEQRRQCMDAMIAYEHRHLPPEQRTGHIPPAPGDQCESAGAAVRTEQPLKWQ